MYLFRSFVAVSVVAASLSTLFPAAAAGQGFNQFVAFGDSTLDSGWYRSTPPLSPNAVFNTDFAIAVTQGGGKATTNPGLVSSEYLAGFFGLSANPANTPGDTNYATGDARNNQINTVASGGLQGAVPTVTQINNYLAFSNGSANPNALYLISSGGNDVAFLTPDRLAYVTTAANDLVAGIAQLSAAGARYIVVRNQPQSFGTSELRSLRTQYDTTLWFGLAARGVNFIPSDFNAVITGVIANPASFGLQFVSNTGTGPACTPVAGVASGWATLCSATSTISTLVSPDAASTHLFADDVHLTTAGQKIVADYEYSLIVAPSQISFLPEVAAKTRASVVNAIFNQIPISQQTQGSSGVNAWLSGDVSFLKLSNAAGFPDDPGTPTAVTAGLDYKISAQWMFGAALSLGTTKQTFSNSGNFGQNDFTASLYTAYSSDFMWVNAIASAGTLRFDINRSVPIGISVQQNNATATGTNFSFSTEAGHTYRTGNISHGPFVGLTLQQIHIGGFTETGGFTSLAFAGQVRHSAVGALGYQAAMDTGLLHPFVKAAWNHELASTDRQITTSLTTIAAPSYSMPAVVLGKDWGNVNIGATMPLSPRTTVLAAVTGLFAQHSATIYGVQAGINAAF